MYHIYIYWTNEKKKPFSRLGFFESGTKMLQNITSAAMTE
jgi:hypothetical protein